MIECELRSFVTDEQFQILFDRLKRDGKYKGQDEQVTYYFDAPQDLRIQKNSTGAKIWLKKGKLHDEQREEIEVPVRNEDFPTLERLFASLKYNVSIQWFRTRHTFEWRDSTVTLDDTKGYGKILELEKLTSEGEKDVALAELKTRFADLGIEPTPREVFDERYAFYKEHWRELVGADVASTAVHLTA